MTKYHVAGGGQVTYRVLVPAKEKKSIWGTVIFFIVATFVALALLGSVLPEQSETPQTPPSTARDA